MNWCSITKFLRQLNQNKTCGCNTFWVAMISDIFQEVAPEHNSKSAFYKISITREKFANDNFMAKMLKDFENLFLFFKK